MDLGCYKMLTERRLGNEKEEARDIQSHALLRGAIRSNAFEGYCGPIVAMREADG